jgi:hypothetical protein
VVTLWTRGGRRQPPCARTSRPRQRAYDTSHQSSPVRRRRATPREANRVPGPRRLPPAIGAAQGSPGPTKKWGYCRESHVDRTSSTVSTGGGILMGDCEESSRIASRSCGDSGSVQNSSLKTRRRGKQMAPRAAPLSDNPLQSRKILRRASFLRPCKRFAPHRESVCTP